MSNSSGFSFSKPVKLWNKPIKADFKELFKSIGKGLVDGALGKWDEVAKDALDATAAVGLRETPEEAAWLLIYRSLAQAMVSLVESNKELLLEKPNENDLESLCDRLNQSLESIELRIDQEFFICPKNLTILASVRTAFGEWLQYFSLNQAQAQTISYRLPTYFVYALHEEWAKYPDKYTCLKEELNTPFTVANEREQRWQRYFAWLQKQVEEPVFLEAFGLTQVYIPLRAYYQRKSEVKESERRGREEEKYERVVVNLETELEAWLNQCNPHDAIRVISGGPGSGKSSFTKILAAHQAEKGEIQILFIPLHHFEPSDDLVEAIGKFVRDDGFLRHNPLEQGDSRLLIIFDGLDELAMQGKIATEIAQQFISEVQRKVDRFNQQKTRLQVLISGRELIVQANSSNFRQPQQILHILPYFVDEEDRKNYIDQQKFLERDQRQDWWQSYGQASGREYAGLPQELNQGNLTEITAQPLLNYLVALSFVRGRVNFSQDSNLNAIYEDLLKAVYERGWTGYQHPTIKEINEKDFLRILEEIALAAWHGDGRTTTIKEIENHCHNSGLQSLLEIFQEGAKLGITRLLAAFYFRQSGANYQGDKTFEFTHKSFGEYLTARRIIREVQIIDKKLKMQKDDPDLGFNEIEALHRWSILCGASAMDGYLFNFVLNEMRLQDLSDINRWQQILSDLISLMLHRGMPMERLEPRPNFQEENQQARNAEEALLAVLNTCVTVTNKVSDIKWPTPEAFGVWISRLHGQRVDVNVLPLNCLSYLNLQACMLILKDFYRANLQGANLQGADLQGAILQRAILEGANLEGTDLPWANLQGANLLDANLEGAILEGANLQGANLQGANLQGVILQGANLQRANLQGTNLQGANLQGANLLEANLQRANLQGVILEGANLQRADLQGAILEGADLQGANLLDANLLDANFQGANLQGAILQGVDLQGADLQGAILENDWDI